MNKTDKAYRAAVKFWMSDKSISKHDAIAATASHAGKAYSTVERALRNRGDGTKESKVEIVGVIGDSHIPYEHPDYLEFCKKTFKEQGVTRVIHIGDIFDNHALSFHDSEPSLVGAAGERELATERLKPWFKAFPKLTLVSGNHDLMANRKAIKAGIDPNIYMKSLGEVYNFPKGWDIVDKVIINNVMYHHGETATGVNGFRNDAKARMMSTVTGHIHSNLGISYTATDHRLVYGMAVGCGVDVDSMAFAYGKNFKLKPVIGCGVVADNGKRPMVFTLDLGEKW